MSTLQFDQFTLACLEAALWSTSNDDDFLDAQYDIRDFAPETLEKLKADCKSFQASQAWQAAIAEDDPRAGRRQRYGCEESGGHDFWLTRCGHGAGFWDGDWKEPHASALDALSKQFGNVDLYVADDGKIYLTSSPT
jgi:hypothetical protein